MDLKVDPSYLPFAKLPKSDDVTKSFLASVAPQTATYYKAVGGVAVAGNLAQQNLNYVIQGDSEYAISLKDSFFTFTLCQDVAAYSPAAGSGTNTPKVQYFTPSNYFVQNCVSHIYVKLQSKDVHDDVNILNVQSAFIRDAIMKPRNYAASCGKSYALNVMQQIGTSPNLAGVTAVKSIANVFQPTHSWTNGKATDEGIFMVDGYPIPNQQPAVAQSPQINGPGNIDLTSGFQTIYSENNGDVMYSPTRKAALTKVAYTAGGYVTGAPADNNLEGFYPQPVEWIYRPKNGIFQSNDLIPPGVQITINTTMASIGNMLQASPCIVNSTASAIQSITPNIYLLSANLWVMRVKLSMSAMEMMKNAQLAGKYIVHMQRSRQISYTINAGATSFRQANILNGQFPNVIVACLSSSTANGGSFYESSLAMSPYSNVLIPSSQTGTYSGVSTGIPFVTYCQLTVNGRRVPIQPFRNTDPQGLQRMYEEYKACTYQYYYKDSPYLTYEQFVSNYQLFCFNTAKADAPADELRQEVSGAHVAFQMQIEFASPLTRDMQITINAIADAGVKIDALGTCSSIGF